MKIKGITSVYFFVLNLGCKLIFAGDIISGIKKVINPIDLWRVKEFDFVLRNMPGDNYGCKILDISSPKMLPLYLTAKNNGEYYITDIVDYFVNDFKKYLSVLSYKKQRLENIYLEIKDARNLNYPSNFFDIIFSVSVFEHIDNDGDIMAVKECARILRPNGMLILTVPLVQRYSEKYIDYNIYTHEKLDSKILFSRYYDLLQLEKRIINASYIMKLTKYEIYCQRVNFYELYLKIPRILRSVVAPFHMLIAKTLIKKKNDISILRHQAIACIVLKKEDVNN